MYRVKLSETYVGLFFDFTDYGEAMGFVGIALENGHYGDEHKQLTATIEIIETEEVGLNDAV